MTAPSSRHVRDHLQRAPLVALGMRDHRNAVPALASAEQLFRRLGRQARGAGTPPGARCEPAKPEARHRVRSNAPVSSMISKPECSTSTARRHARAGARAGPRGRANGAVDAPATRSGAACTTISRTPSACSRAMTMAEWSALGEPSSTPGQEVRVEVDHGAATAESRDMARAESAGMLVRRTRRRTRTRT